MQRVTIYLRTALFTFGGDNGHVPFGATVIEGEIEAPDSGTLTVFARRFLDERGRQVSEARLKLLVPWSKIDHVHVDDTKK